MFVRFACNLILLVGGAVLLTGCLTVDPDDPPGDVSASDEDELGGRETQVDAVPEYSFLTGNREVYVYDLSNDQAERLTEDPSRQYFNPTWSPDGERIAVTSSEPDDSSRISIHLIGTDGSDPRELPGEPNQRHITWSPEGDRIAFVDDSDLPGSWPEIVMTGPGRDGTDRLTSNADAEPESRFVLIEDPAWSPDGEEIVFAGMLESGDASSSDLFIVDAEDGVETRRLTDELEMTFSEPAWSPDGSRIVAVASGWMLPEPQLHIIDAHTGEMRALDEVSGQPRSPSWSGDGERIVFQTESSGVPELYTIDVDGTNLTPITSSAKRFSDPDWSPNDRLAVISPDNPQPAIPCSAESITMGETAREPGALAWTSNEVVVGTVIEELDPAWADPVIQQGSDPCLDIVTDYRVRVDTRYRGLPSEVLRVRVQGGEIGDYQQIHRPSPSFETGERYLFFLTPELPRELVPGAYTVDHTRVIELEDGVVPPEIHEQLREALSGNPEDYTNGAVVEPFESPIFNPVVE